jgi:hypothetical protein
MVILKLYEINLLCRQFHKYLLNEHFELIQEDIINKYKLDILINTQDKGLISLILQYGIKTCNYEIIEKIKPYLSMKRDFLHLILYNKQDTINCIEIFKKNINLELFLQKDLEFIVENKLYFLLPLLEEMFLKLNINGSDLYNSILKKYTLQNTHKYITHFSNKINNKSIKKFNNLISNNYYNSIIDAGNILFSRMGQIGSHSIQDLKTVVDAFPNSLIIIHKRHLKDTQINDILKEKLYYATPKNIDDDLFTILAYLNNQVNIITNDTFNDHFNDYSINDNYLRCHINDILIKYINDEGVFTFKPICKYTECIQIINNCVYIPSSKNGFIEIII